MIKQILLIDDDPVINFIHTKLLRKKFPDIPLLTFTNGQAGLMHIKTNLADSYVIFLDLNMPKMNGWEFLKAISSEANEVDLKVHIVTSSINPEDKMQAENYEHVLSYIVKPLKDKDLEHITLV
ncbi:response regulator [Algoriphagus sp. AGSA1]|uniref:response regulator n=1 Tax=Algoriphagus sp. AGSA1 TaxID=2907213 RepID=UPI001F291C74|nr:response regulator [Algoriphagus sp. AGSA1]MCE7056095.1 response regulator [Algoriphagus sp. AGSA1]